MPCNADFIGKLRITLIWYKSSELTLKISGYSTSGYSTVEKNKDFSRTHGRKSGKLAGTVILDYDFLD